MSDGLVVASWGLCWLMAAMSPVSATTVVWRFRDSRRFIEGLSAYWVVWMRRVAVMGFFLSQLPNQVHLFLGGFNDALGGKTKLGLQFLQRCGGAEGVHANYAPGATYVSFP